MGGAVQVGCRQAFHHAAGVHHQHPVAEVANQVQVVTDEQQRQALLGHQLVQQCQHFLAHRDIQRRSGFVGNQQLRPLRQHHRDHHPLTHAAGQLVRKLSGHPLRLANAHTLQQGLDRASTFAASHALDSLHGLADL